MNSVLDNYTKEELQKIIDSSNSIMEVLTSVGLSGRGTGSYHTFYNRVETLGLEIEGLKLRSKNGPKSELFKKKSLDEILVENSKSNRTHLKHRLIDEGLFENKCSICGQLPEWNGKPLTLQLDHINGVHNDNRLENLRIVCPHCHSQLETTKKRSDKSRYFCSCGKEINKYSKCCRECADKLKKKFDPSKEELEQKILVEKIPFTRLGKHYGVSDNAVRKRAKSMGII